MRGRGTVTCCALPARWERDVPGERTMTDLGRIAGFFRPRGPRFGRGGFTVASVASVGVLALMTGACGSPSARKDAARSNGVAAADSRANGAPNVDDKGFSLLHNGQHDQNMAIHTLDPPTQKALDAQLAVSREIAKQTPTVADAERKGYSRVGPYFPGIGGHYWKGVKSYG